VPPAIVDLIAMPDHTARLVGRTREAMEFSVTPQ
jgi:hypothetical protein